MTLIPPLGPPGTLWDPLGPPWGSQGVPEEKLKLEFNGKVAWNNGLNNVFSSSIFNEEGPFQRYLRKTS